MSIAEIALIILLVLAVVTFLLTNFARRLDALHKRVVNSLAVLDAQLVRRAELSMALANSGALDDASAVILAEAAWAAGIESERLVGADPSREAPSLGELAQMSTTRGIDRSHAETALTFVLRTSLGDTNDLKKIEENIVGKELISELRSTCHRVQLARRFHNDAVESVLKLRQRWIVQVARLAGRAALPHVFEMDDDVFPQGETA